MSCSALAEWFGLSHTAIRTIDAEVLKETAQDVDLSKLRRLLVDEKRIAKRRFVTLILDADSHSVLALIPGARSEGLASYLGSFLHLAQL